MYDDFPYFSDSFASPTSSPRGTAAPMPPAPLHAVGTAAPIPITNGTGVVGASMEEHESPLLASSPRAPAPAPVPETLGGAVGGRNLDLPNWAIESVVPSVVEDSPVNNINNAAAAAAAIGGGNGSSNPHGAPLADSEYMDMEDDIIDDDNMGEGNMDDGNVYGTTTDSPAVLMGSPFELDGGGSSTGATPY